VTLPPLVTIEGYVAITALVPPAVAVVFTLALAGARSRMPGGGPRLFKALWLQSVGLIFGFLAARLLWDTFFGAPQSQTIEENLITLLCVLPASVGSAWLFRRLPWTAQLVRDLAAAMRRPTNYGKA
jgi:hypothetical protein